MKILIISSCTKAKDTRGFPSILSRTEIDKLRLSGLLKSRSETGRAARTLYIGPQHKQLFAGVDLLREQYGTVFCSVKIISAAYGLVSEMQPYCLTKRPSRNEVSIPLFVEEIYKSPRTFSRV